MTKVVAKGLNSAMQHHPLSPTLYLLLSYHHLHPGAPLPRSSIPSTSRLDLPSAREESSAAASAFALEGTQPARTTLLLGLRVLPSSHLLWREYVKLELGWVEALRRRWHVLGINVKTTDETFDGDAAALAGGEGAFGEEGEEARRAILSGQLVVHALQEALNKVSAAEKVHEDGGKLLDGIAFRSGMIDMLRAYPSPLRTKALGVVYSDLEKIAADGGVEGAKARLLLVTRPLYDRKYEAGEKPTSGVVVSGVALVEALGAIGKEIRSIAKTAGPEWIEVAGLWLADRTAETNDNADLQRYLFSTLKALTKSSFSPPASFLVRHLELVDVLDKDAYLSTARSHAAQHPSNPALQLARVRAEVEGSDVEAIRKACADAASKVTARNLSTEEQDEVIALWRTWAKWEEEHGSDAQWKKLLRDSLRLGAAIPALHSALLASYFAAKLRAGFPPQEALDAVVKPYQPSAAFFTLAFPDIAELVGTQPNLAKFYRAWRAACKTAAERVDAVLAWAGWLMDLGKGRDAYSAVDVVRREVRDDEGETARLEAGWKALIDAADAQKDGDDDVEMEESDESGSEDESEEDGSDDEEEGSEEEDEEDEEDEEEDEDMDGGLEIAL